MLYSTSISLNVHACFTTAASLAFETGKGGHKKGPVPR